MTRNELIASLAAVHADICMPGDGYIDLATTADEDGAYALEVGEDLNDPEAAAAVVHMTRNDLVQLHAQLTALLLRTA